MPTAPIVGMHFRPPARTVIDILPGLTPLRLVREPENPYDSNAVAVYLEEWPAGVKETLEEMINSRLEGEIAEWNADVLMLPFHLGYIANNEKTGGRHADTIASHLDAVGETALGAELTFGADGKAQAAYNLD